MGRRFVDQAASDDSCNSVDHSADTWNIFHFSWPWEMAQNTLKFETLKSWFYSKEIFSQLKKIYQMAGENKNSIEEENSSWPGKNEACLEDCS